MDESIVLVIVVAVISFVGSMMKKAQTVQNANKKATSAVPKQASKPLEAPMQPQARAFGDTMSPFGNQDSQPETMRPFGDQERQMGGSMQTQAMSTAFQSEHTDHRIARGETMDERDAGVRAQRDADSNHIDLQWDKDSLLQGIILAEVLKRPKPGGFKKLPANR